MANNVWLSLGGVHVVSEEDPGKITNTHIMIDNKGEIRETYNKAHLFDVNIPNSVSLSESSYVTPGWRLAPPVPTPLGEDRALSCLTIDMKAGSVWASVTT